MSVKPSIVVDRVAVIGGTGRLGRITVQKLVEKGIKCNVLVRSKLPTSSTSTSTTTTTSNDYDPTTATKDEVLSYFSSLVKGEGEGDDDRTMITMYEGDVTNIDALKPLLADCTACLAVYGSTRRSKISDIWNYDTVSNNDKSHAKQINYLGVENIIKVATSTNSICKRIIRITGQEDPESIFSVLINAFGSMAKAWNYEGERLLRASNLEYTIIRPGVMGFDGPIPSTDNKALILTDDGEPISPVTKIRYNDIADLCIESLNYPNTARTTLTAMTTADDGSSGSSSNGESSWSSFLQNKVQPDRKKFAEDMLDRNYAAVKSFLYKFSAFATIVMAIFVRSIVNMIFS